MKDHDPNARGRNGTPSDPEPKDRSPERSTDPAMDAAHREMEELIELAGLSDEERERQAALEAGDPLTTSAEERVLERARRKLGLPSSPESQAPTPPAPIPWTRSTPFRWAAAVAALLVVGFSVRLWMAPGEPDYDPNTTLGEGEGFEIIAPEGTVGFPGALEWSGGPAAAEYYVVHVYDYASPGDEPIDSSDPLSNSPWIIPSERSRGWPDHILVRVVAYGSGSEQLLRSTDYRSFVRAT